MSFQQLLDSQCSIRHETLGAPDGQGGFLPATWAILYNNVPCRFETLWRDEEILAHDKKTVYPRYYFYIVYRSGIKEGDRIYHKSRQFEIKLVENWSEQNEKLQLEVTELKRGVV
jgi:hypothetical protein